MSGIDSLCTHDSRNCIQIPKMISIYSPALTQEWPCCFPPLRVRLCLEADTFLSSPVCRTAGCGVLEILDKCPSQGSREGAWYNINLGESITTKTPFVFVNCTSMVNLEKAEKGPFDARVSSHKLQVLIWSHQHCGQIKDCLLCRTTVGYLMSKNLPTSFFPCHVPFPYPDPKILSPKQRWVTWSLWLDLPQA